MSTRSGRLIADPLSTLVPGRLDLSGRRALVTGGAGGLGAVTARRLARLGASVTVGVRDVQRARAVLQPTADASEPIEIVDLDLLDAASIERFASRAADRPLDLLIANAGSSSGPFRLTGWGVESQFGTNHLGHFALVGRLLDALDAGTDPRVVTVSSSLYVAGRLDLDRLAEPAGYSPGRAYNASKLANVRFAVELERRLRATDRRVRSFAAHPGMARTPLHRTYPSAVTRAITRTLARAVGREPEPAAAAILAAALSPEVAPDAFWGPVGSKTHPDVSGVGFAPVALDPAAGAALWEFSERLTGVRALAG